MKTSDIHFFNINNKQLVFHYPTAQLYNVSSIDNKNISSFENDKFIKHLAKKLEKEINKHSAGNFNEEKFIDQNILQNVTLPISGKCNLKCDYCFARTNGKFEFDDISPFMSYKIIDFILNQNNNLNYTKITFFGGEPFLNIDTIKKTILYTKDKYKNRKIIFTATTNGTIINNELLKLIIDHDIKLMVSIDGPPDIAQHRNYINGENCFNDVLKNIKLLQQKKIDFVLRATIPNDIKDIKKIFEFFENLKIPFYTVFAYSSFNKTHDLSNFSNKCQDLQKQFLLFNEYYINKIINKEPIYCETLLRDLEKIRYRIYGKYSCTSGCNYFSITSSGNIFTCEHLIHDKKFAIGNINKNINYDLLLQYKPKNVDTLTECINCWIKYFCKGGCLSEKISDGNLNNRMNEGYCNLQKIYWENVLYIYSNILQDNISTLNKNDKINNPC